MYTAYVLTQRTRQSLIRKFPPKYPKFIGHHITFDFNVPKGTLPPPLPASVEVIRHVDSGDGLEVLVVTIDGKLTRPDQRYFHITWSLDPDRYKPVDSNDLLVNISYSELIIPTFNPIKINVSPDVLS